MKLWHKCRKRLAKKRIGRYWKKLNLARQLKLGDLIHTCKGYNEPLTSFEPVYDKTGRIIRDFDVNEDCSLVHCCELPVLSKTEIDEYWEWFEQMFQINPRRSELMFGKSFEELYPGPFDDNGVPVNASSN